MKGHNYANPPCRKCGRTHIHPQGMRGRKPWNKGLTKETDERIKTWNKGLTVRTDKRVAAYVQKSARAIRLQFKNGRVGPNKGKIPPWMLGDKNIAKRLEVRQKISASLTGQKKPWLVSRNKSEQLRNFNRKRLIDAWENIEDGMVFESPNHRALKMLAKEFLLSEGFQVDIERHVRCGSHCYKVDVYAKKNDERVAIECGECPEEKLLNLYALCSAVIHIPYPAGGM